MSKIPSDLRNWKSKQVKGPLGLCWPVEVPEVYEKDIDTDAPYRSTLWLIREIFEDYVAATTACGIFGKKIDSILTFDSRTCSQLYNDTMEQLGYRHYA